MNTVKILHCGDIHIGAECSFLEGKADARRRETLLTFEKIVDLCIDENVKVLLIAGDLFNSNDTQNSLAEGVFSKIKSASKLKVIYCAGNHDPLNPRSPFMRECLPENLYVLDTRDTVLSFPELNLRVYGRSFETAFSEGKPHPELIPPKDDVINIALLHGELFGELSSRYNAITREYIESSEMDYIALGHIHKASDVTKIGNTSFAYCGCPEGQGFDELGQKGVYMGEIGKGICNLQFVPTAKRLHILEQIDVTDISLTTEYILKLLNRKYGDGYLENLYKLELVGNKCEADLSDLLSRLNDRLYFVKLKDSTEPEPDLETLSHERTLKGIFVKKMLEKISTAENKKPYETALKLGLKAFSCEVKYNEN